MSNERGRARTTLLAAVVLLVTFAAGVAIGVAGHRAFLMRGHERGAKHITQFMLERLDRQLELTDAQRRDVEQILKRRHERISVTRREMRGRIGREIDATNAEIERVLSPEQRAKFKKMRIHLRGRGHPPPM